MASLAPWRENRSFQDEGLDAQDAAEQGLGDDLSNTPDVAAKIARLQARQERKRALLKQLEDRGET